MQETADVVDPAGSATRQAGSRSLNLFDQARRRSAEKGAGINPPISIRPSSGPAQLYAEADAETLLWYVEKELDRIAASMT